MKREVGEVIERHAASGRWFEAAGVRSFVRDREPAGGGATVLLLHGVPTSSFVYRRLFAPLADQGLRPIAVDLPGLGLADRPTAFDYTWTGLQRWLEAAIDALEIDRCHLVVHDIGGPIGCSWAIGNPERVHSLTALNTMLAVSSFRPSWPMWPFARRGLGELWLAAMRRRPMAELYYRVGVADRAAVPLREVYAHHHLLKRRDGGRAFLRIMRGFELTDERERALRSGLAQRPFPARVVWGELDPALGGELDSVCEILGVADPVLVRAGHYPQEEAAEAVAGAVADLVAPLG